MSRTIIDKGIFITNVAQSSVVEGYMIIERDRIVYLGSTPPNREPDDVVINGRHKLYLPGLVNTHGHAAMSLLRGYGDDMALKVWLEEKMWPMEAKFTANHVKWGTQLSILEMLTGGTTAFVDMYDHMDEVAMAVEQSGIRGCLTRGVIGLCSTEIQEAKLHEAIQFAKTWHLQAEGRITTMLAPHAPYTCPPDYIEKFVIAAHDLSLPIHTHLSETALEVLTHEHTYQKRPVAHLAQLGVFSRPTLVAHAVHLTNDEIEMLAEYQVHVSHNPGSNLKLASGIARVPDLLKAGILVSLGTDSAASNNNLDMFEEIRLAALIHKGVTQEPTVVNASQALAMGTTVGASSLWLSDVGNLQVGNKADFIAVNIDQPHFLPKSNYISHLVYAASAQDVVDVCIDGKWIVRNRECLTLDAEQIKYHFQKCYEELTK
jgi:5-methylthioadenosine/S-adenosylhomocysteine deaminase